MEDALNHEKSDKQREALSWMDNKPIHYVEPKAWADIIEGVQDYKSTNTRHHAKRWTIDAMFVYGFITGGAWAAITVIVAAAVTHVLR